MKRQPHVKSLIKTGFKIIPLDEGGKRPHVKKFRNEGSVSKYFLDLENDKIDNDTLVDHWVKYPNSNVGIYCLDLVIIDTDNEEAESWGLKNLSTPYKVKTGKGTHFYYRPDKRLNVKAVIQSQQTGIDIKHGKNHYVVAPPSYHSGADRFYAWFDDNDPIDLESIPMISKSEWADIKKFMGADEKKKKKTTELEMSAVLKFYGYDSSDFFKLQSCCFSDHKDTKKSFRVRGEKFHCSCLPTQTGGPLEFIARHEGYLSQGESLWTSKEALKKSAKKAKEICPDLISEYENNQQIIHNLIAEINQEYFFFEGSGNNPIMREDDNLITPISIRNFVTSKSSTKVGNQTIGELWVSHPSRRTFRKIVFKPDEQEEMDEYNRFVGWGVNHEEEHQVRPDNILFHLRTVLACDDESIYEYLLDWIADMIQNPSNPVKSSIGIVGGQGTGKGSFIEILRPLLNNYLGECSDTSYITHRFNQYLQNKLLIYLDEALFGGSIKTSNKMKQFITAPKLNIEIKGGAVYQCPNFMRIVAASNENHFVHLDEDDRRWLILEVNPEYKNDLVYFGKLYKAIKSEAPAFLDMMLNREITRSMSEIPNTVKKNELQFQSLSHLDHYWLECLLHGDIVPEANEGLDAPLVENWEKERLLVETNYVRDSLHVYLDKVKAGEFHRPSPTKLGIYLKKATGNLLSKTRTQTVRDGSKYLYGLPSLSECRLSFCQRFGFEKWEELEDALGIDNKEIAIPVSKTSIF